MSGTVEIVATSPAVLAADGGLSRSPRAPWRKRSADFEATFDRLTLFYDCFRHADNDRVLLVGPPLRNLRKAFAAARFSVDGRDVALTPAIHSTVTVTIVALSGMPNGAQTLGLAIGNQQFTLPIRDNLSQRLAGKRVLFTTSRNNALPWFSAWADYYRRFHGVDAVILFDNGSTNASIAEIGAALAASGIPEVFVVPWNHRFGAFDPRIIFNPYWAHFAPMGAMSVALRRFAAHAAGLVNCDVDELMTTPAVPDIFAELDATPHGLLVMHGRWIEASPSDRRFGDHRDFRHRLKGERNWRCLQRKWVLDPRRAWVGNLDNHPYFHWIANRPRKAKTISDSAFYWHFKGINTNWKTARNVALALDADSIEPDPDLAKMLARWGV